MKHNDNSDSRTRAIQTRYKGYHFRSRLEARYAVFFDALGIKWEYEKEGFDLGERLGPYLPDFWVSNADPNWGGDGAWVEIKGELQGDLWATTLEEKKLLKLSELTGFESFLCVGLPELEGTRTTHVYPCEHCEVHATRENTVFLLASNYMDYRIRRDDLAWIDEASAVAKSARFEYGETPRIR